jgi:NADH:ubiquinone oxidoreductase subunit K
MNEKHWWQSKTIWLNAVLFVIAVIGVLIDSSLLDQYDEVLLLIATILNLVLRYFYTNTALK